MTEQIFWKEVAVSMGTLKCTGHCGVGDHFLGPPRLKELQDASETQVRGWGFLRLSELPEGFGVGGEFAEPQDNIPCKRVGGQRGHSTAWAWL